MRPVRFTAPVCWIGIAFLECLIGTALGEGAKPSNAPVDRVREAMTREVAAKALANKAILDRLKAMPAPPVAAMPQGLGGRAPIFVMEELEPDDEADERAPRRWVQAYSEQAFDHYLFGYAAGEEFWRKRLVRLLDGKVEHAVRQHQLSPEKKTKLRLAGKGDIKRLFNEIEDKRKEFEALRRDLPKADVFLKELQQLRLAPMNGPWGDESFFSKVLDTMLADRAADARRT